MRLLIYKAAWLRDKGEDYTVLVAMAKLVAGELTQEAATFAIAVYGHPGYVRERGSEGVERLHRDARGLTIAEGMSDIQRLIIGRSAVFGE